ncbi:hypothetical protein ES707_12985 [subsurface metagenome]
MGASDWTNGIAPATFGIVITLRAALSTFLRELPIEASTVAAIAPSNIGASLINTLLCFSRSSI